MQLPIFGKVKKPIPWVIGLLAAGLLGTATAVILTIRSTTPKSDITNLTVAVASRNLTVQIKANGVVQAVRKINLSPKEAGRIAQLYVDEGDQVEQGKLLARMESEQFQAQVDQYKAAVVKASAELAEKRTGTRPEEIAEAQARVATAQANIADAQAQLNRATEELKRNQFLAQQGAISRDTLGDFLSKERQAQANLEAQNAGLREQRESLKKLRNGTRKEEIAASEADLNQAKAQLLYYETQLENTFIRAPFAGTITRRFAQKGDFVTPTTSASSSDGATSASIAELSSGLEVEAKVPEVSMARIKPGQNVEIRADAYPDNVFKGRVRLIAPTAVKEDNVTFIRVKVDLQTGQDLLKPGINVKLTFLGKQISNALVVPLAAIITKKDGQTGVLIPDQNNKAQFRPVTVGVTSGNQTQILQGASEGERVFIQPPADQKIDGVDTIAF
ncbi:efflux RND transporter periplasmic adaptor subunit [Nostoc sp. 'Peltigera membranacea cyanobiont' 232]|uniref:efflux RND transporter periplasmic adaptor subunit n=1 Tax=Nostoc sp. 'Peltigera membranacea cyanobiont' 232 TaxID=2014531 RepID=UPI000B9508FC|nr:efflux RND transporter periplasmic adaptor subunit [Nostoc sp. 'Peltigera membranacea cyanobiont' 232]OYE04344.1 efflux transporter periplasmic adaptor subunit [Nostoc sp. 'Peltigera membranacea cyanobiont' 232]